MAKQIVSDIEEELQNKVLPIIGNQMSGWNH
jgi:hypothetical protein